MDNTRCKEYTNKLKEIKKKLNYPSSIEKAQEMSLWSNLVIVTPYRNNGAQFF